MNDSHEFAYVTSEKERENPLEWVELRVSRASERFVEERGQEETQGASG
jgi:hypothetical protein